MSILDFKTKKTEPEAPAALEIKMRVELKVTLKNGVWFAFNLPYRSELTLEKHWKDFYPWFRADVTAKSYTIEWKSSETDFGQRTIVRDEIQMIELTLREVKP